MCVLVVYEIQYAIEFTTYLRFYHFLLYGLKVLHSIDMIRSGKKSDTKKKSKFLAKRIRMIQCIQFDDCLSHDILTTTKNQLDGVVA